MIIASWNIESRLSNNDLNSRGNSDDIINLIENINADILLLLEAHNDKDLDPKIKNKFIELGYETHNVPYEDDMAERNDSIEDMSSMLLLSKLPIEDFKIIRLGSLRNALVAKISCDNNRIIQIVGIHLDDRSETTRLNQAKDLIKIVNNSILPTIVMGDFNAMHGEDIWPAKFLGSNLIRKLAKYIIPNISLKAVEMAEGKVLKLIESKTQLTDADDRHRPTTTPKMKLREWMPSIRLIQIDHIYISDKILTSNFKIYKDGGSDHRAISLKIEIK